MSTILHLLENLSIKLNRVSEILLGIIGSVLILIVSTGIVFRYIFKLPLTWSYEISVVCFIWVSFQGAAYSLGKGSHVSSDFVRKQSRCRIQEKGYKNRPLTDSQKERNKGKSKIRARIEHIFGFVHTMMNGSRIRTNGIGRAWVIIGLMNLAYNLCRYIRYQDHCISGKFLEVS